METINHEIEAKNFDIINSKAADRAELRVAINNGDYNVIEKVLLSIIAKQPDSVQEKIELVDHSLTHGRQDKAFLYLQNVGIDTCERDPNVPVHVYESLLRIYLRLKNTQSAVNVARLFANDFGEMPRLAIMCLRAFDRGGDEPGFRAAYEAAFGVCQNDDAFLAEILFMLNSRSMSNRVVELMQGADIRKAGHFDLAFQYCRALSEIDPTGSETIKAAEIAHEIGGKQQKSARLLSKLYLSVNRNHDALDILGSSDLSDQPESVRAQHADALMANQQFAQAADIYLKLVEKNPNHGGWSRACASALLLAGDESAAKKLYAEDLQNRGLSEFANFQEALDAIGDNLDKAKIPAYRFDWAYEKLKSLGCAPQNRDAWEDQCKWVNLADHLTINWLEARREDADEILPLINGAREAKDLLMENKDKGVGAFIASAHIGALFAGPFALAKSGLNYRWVASTPMVSNAPGAEHLLSTFSKNKFALARKIFGAVKKGAIVSIAIDGNSGVETSSVPFMGETIRLSDFIPRAVFQTGANSFFPKVLWVDGRVTIDLVKLVMPSPEDTLEDFIETWFIDFTTQLTNVFRESPQNLRLTGGFWDEVTL